MITSIIKMRFDLGLLLSLLFCVACSSTALGQFEITYFDNYNYDTLLWDAWQTVSTPLDAWDSKYLATESSGKTVFTDHAFESIDVFDLRGGLFSKDGHATGGEDWNPLESIGDDVSGQSPHHVFAALFTGLVYLEEDDVLSVESDDDVYIFLDGDTAWGQEILSDPGIHYFGNVSTTITAAQEGYHTMTVKFIERQDVHSGIQINLNDLPLEAARGPGTPGYWKKHFADWIVYIPSDSFVDVFQVPIEIKVGGKNTNTNPTLLEALEANGGGVNALARHAVAALLNASHPGITYYPASVAEIIAAVQDAWALGEPYITEQKDIFDEWNNLASL